MSGKLQALSNCDDNYHHHHLCDVSPSSVQSQRLAQHLASGRCSLRTLDNFL